MRPPKEVKRLPKKVEVEVECWMSSWRLSDGVNFFSAFYFRQFCFVEARLPGSQNEKKPSRKRIKKIPFLEGKGIREMCLLIQRAFNFSLWELCLTSAQKEGRNKEKLGMWVHLNLLIARLKISNDVIKKDKVKKCPPQKSGLRNASCELCGLGKTPLEPASLRARARLAGIPNQKTNNQESKTKSKSIDSISPTPSPPHCPLARRPKSPNRRP